jgi:hypothetical protein
MDTPDFLYGTPPEYVGESDACIKNERF